MLSLYIFVVFECFVVKGDMEEEIGRGRRCVDDDVAVDVDTMSILSEGRMINFETKAERANNTIKSCQEAREGGLKSQ